MQALRTAGNSSNAIDITVAELSEVLPNLRLPSPLMRGNP